METTKVMANFAFPGPILLGCGRCHEIGKQAAALGSKKPLLVTGPSILKSSIGERVLASLHASALSAVVYSEAHLNPTDRDIFAGAERFKSSECDIVIAVGGGSRMDVAKGIRLAVSHPGPLSDYYFDVGGADRIKNPQPPLIAVPTIAGSGSEVSRGAIVTDLAANRKRLLAGPGMMASIVILDPELNVSAAPDLTAVGGMDALCHAIETYVGTGFHPFAEALSLHAIEILCRSLPVAFRDGSDLDARSHLMIGSTMAGLCFARGLGVVHSLAHQLTPACGIGHGLAVAVLLPWGMEYNLDCVTSRYARIARAMGLANGSDHDAMAVEAINAVRRLQAELSIPDRLSKIGVTRDHLPALAVNAMLDHCHRTNPKACGQSSMRQILELAL